MRTITVAILATLTLGLTGCGGTEHHGPDGPSPDVQKAQQQAEWLEQQYRQMSPTQRQVLRRIEARQQAGQR